MDGFAASELDVETVDAMRGQDRPIAVLDVREPWEWAICALEGSILVPLGRLPAHVDELPRDRPLVVICHHGIRSAHAVTWLRAQGFDKAVNLTGGIDAWSRRINPTMRRY